MSALRVAATTTLAMIASYVSLIWISRACGGDPATGVTAAALALTLGQRPMTRRQPLPFELVTLPAVGLAATGVGWLLVHQPIVGALTFTVGMFASIWLRRFGARAAMAGTLIALPLIAILVVPAPHLARVSLATIALPLLAGVVALAWVQAAEFVLRRLAPLPEDASRLFVPAPREQKPGTLAASTKMALQMAVAVGLAFAVGYRWFPEHWSWAVLTAFIVCSGNRGRDDVVYKSVLRFAGALAGTLVAFSLQRVVVPTGIGEGIAIFAVVFAGLWLRPFSYAYWAAAVTLVVAALQQTLGANGQFALGMRLEEIVAGALCGIAASWFVLPIRTESVALLHVAGALGALDRSARLPLAQHDERESHLRLFEHHVDELDHVRAPLRSHWRFIDRRRTSDHPAAWIDELRGCRGALISYRGDREPLLRAVGTARKALGFRVRGPNASESDASEQLTVAAALQRLRAVLTSSAND